MFAPVIAETMTKYGIDTPLCCDAAGWFWHERGLNALADNDDIQAITRCINGGLNGIVERRRLLKLAKKELGVNAG